MMAVLAVVGSSARAEERETAWQRVNSPRLLIIAHRGHSSVAPENTLPAFRSAVEAGADLIELDYYHTADEVPVVFHDKTLDRTTNAGGVLGKQKLSISEVPLSGLRRLDAGSWFHPRFQDAGIPTLEEALDVIQPASMTLIERKAGDAARCVQLLRQRGEVEQVVVQAFDWDFLRDCHRREPRLVLGALGDKELTAERLSELADSGASVVGWNHKFIGKREIDMIHAAGKKAWVYTVNDVARARELIAAGIDGIITDRAGEFLQQLRQAPASE